MLLRSQMWDVMLHQVSDCWNFKGLKVKQPKENSQSSWPA
jgi:hypothetical protein